MVERAWASSRLSPFGVPDSVSGQNLIMSEHQTGTEGLQRMLGVTSKLPFFVKGVVGLAYSRACISQH